MRRSSTAEELHIDWGRPAVELNGSRSLSGEHGRPFAGAGYGSCAPGRRDTLVPIEVQPEGQPAHELHGVAQRRPVQPGERLGS